MSECSRVFRIWYLFFFLGYCDADYSQKSGIACIPPLSHPHVIYLSLL